jgi:protein-arginine kinase activator protein McsA
MKDVRHMTKKEMKKETRKLVSSIDCMSKNLWRAVDEERYEDAAVLRDDLAIKQKELMFKLAGWHEVLIH